jgi:hypothetical protein
VLRWESGSGSLAKSRQARVCGQPAWGKLGVAISVTGHVYRSLYLGTIFDCTAAVITPAREADRLALTACLLDSGFPQAVRSVDQALSVTESSFLKVDFEQAGKFAGERCKASRDPFGNETVPPVEKKARSTGASEGKPWLGS